MGFFERACVQRSPDTSIVYSQDHVWVPSESTTITNIQLYEEEIAYE